MELIAKANELQKPPTVLIHDGLPVLDFSAFAQFLGNQPRDFGVSALSATKSAQINCHIAAFQVFQDVRSRRSGCVNDKSPPPGGMYQCTIGRGCSQSFKRKGDWKRHENTHYPQEVWLCEYQACASSPKPFLREEHFSKHFARTHPGTDSTTGKPDNFRHEVPGSQWPRRCPFQACENSSFLTFDDRLEHIAKKHVKKNNEVSVGNEDGGRGNGDQDRNGKGGGRSDNSSKFQRSKDHSQGSLHSGQASTGANGSGNTSSYTHSASSSSYQASDDRNELNNQLVNVAPDTIPKPMSSSGIPQDAQLVATQYRISTHKAITSPSHAKRTTHPSKIEECPISPINHGRAAHLRKEPTSNHMDTFKVRKRKKSLQTVNKDQEFSVKLISPRNLLKEHDLVAKMVPSHLVIQHYSFHVERFLLERLVDGPWTAFKFRSKQAYDFLGEKIHRLDLTISASHFSEVS